MESLAVPPCLPSQILCVSTMTQKPGSIFIFVSLQMSVSWLNFHSFWTSELATRWRFLFKMYVFSWATVMTCTKTSVVVFQVITNLSVQAPVFISFFIALRKMAYLPVPSLQTGGMLWFPDLTAADPFYILPLAVTGTMFFILEVSHLLPNLLERKKERSKYLFFLNSYNAWRIKHFR